MKTKTIAICTCLGVASISLGVLALMANGFLKVSSTVKYAEKDVSLEFNASNLSSGSGTVTLNGNLFTYENLTVNGNAITLGSGSRIYANENSGSSVGANGMMGAGFSSIVFYGGSGGSASGQLNSVAFDIEIENNGTGFKAINNNAFDLSITTGSLVLNKMVLTYGCQYNEDPVTQKVLFVGSDNMGVSSWKTAYAEAVNAIEGITAECDQFTTGSFTFLQIGNMETNYANKAQEFREKLASESWDAVYFQLSRRITPSGVDLYNAEFEMFKDVIVPLTKNVTTNITLLAMEATENPTIFDYDDTDGQPVSTGETETKTVEQMTTFMEETAVEWANAAGIKAARYGTVFNYCGTVGSNSDTRNKAKAYARGLMAYATINETPIPEGIATTWASTVFPSTSSAAKEIKNNIGAQVNNVVFG